MRRVAYGFWVLLAWIRGLAPSTWRARAMLKGPTCTTGLNGPGDDKTRYALYRKHHWRPLIYRWSHGSVSRTFRVVEEGQSNEPGPN